MNNFESMDDPIYKLFSHLDKLSALKSAGAPAAPIMVDIDPVDGLCNLDCDWCCQAASRLSRPVKYMSVATMKMLGAFSQAWGIKSWRIAGDSEPLLNKNISYLIESGSRHQINMGLITNGVYLDRLSRTDLSRLDWLGISLDASNQETWAILKHSKSANFDRIINNIKMARIIAPRLDISIKFLRWSSEENLNKNSFRMPVVMAGAESKKNMISAGSNKSEEGSFIALAEALGVRAIIRDSYPRDFASRYNFATCRATPLGGVFDASHNFHLCCDARNIYVLTDDYTRDNWHELPNLWGGSKHKDLMTSIQPKKCLGCAKYRINNVLEKFVFSDTAGDNFI
jgi:hypothetical protein